MSRAVPWFLLLVPALPACELLDGLGPGEDLGQFEISDTGGYVDVTLTVPGSPVGTMAYCGGFGDDALGAVWTLTDPSGNVVYSGDDPGASMFRSDFVDDLSPMVLPMTPELPLTAGDWMVQWFIGAGNGGRIDCGAIHRTGSVSDAATVDVEVMLVGLEVESDDPNLATALDQLSAEWATANLTPNITVVDFPGDTDRFAVVDIDTARDDYREFNDLLRTTRSSNAVTFFLVEELRDAAGGVLLGLSAGPPGAAGLPGTSKSGVVVTASDLATAPADVGKIMAHEGGHFLGLFHTTERDGGQHDPLADTPECPPSADSDGNGRLSVAECAGLDGSNVMFWTLTEGSASLSADQSYVLRRNPIVQ